MKLRFRFLLYYAICSIGLIGVIRVHIRFIYMLFFKVNTAPIYEHIGRWADKPVELFFFFVGSIVLMLYSMVVYSTWNCLQSNRAVRLVWRCGALIPTELACFVVIVLLNVTIGFSFWREWFGASGSLLGDLLWIVMIVLPALITWTIIKYRKTLLSHSKETVLGAKKIYVLFIVVSFLQFASMIWPFVVNPLNMMGEYLDIPVRTLVNGKYVDNAAYYSEHKLLGIQPRYQIDRDGSPLPRFNSEACLYIDMSPAVEQLLQASQKRAAYFYDKPSGQLCNTGPIIPSDWLLIRQAAKDSETLLRAEAWLAKDAERNNFWQQRIYTPEELDFIVDNKFALEFQLNGIWVLHHHNFVLGPINEYALGKPQQEIFPQYGWLNMAVTSKMMEWMGGVTYDRYFKVWYSYFIIYFILLIGLYWLVFRHPGYVALAAVLSVGLMSCIPFIWYFQGPGLNPVRHFFDVFVASGFYLYLTKERPVFLIAALGFSLLGILNNTQLGLACFGALVTSVSLVWFQRSIDFNRRMLLTVASSVLLGVWLFFGHPFWNAGVLNQYYLMGISSLPTLASREIGILIICGLADFVLWRHMGKGGDRFKYFVLFLLLYSQGSLLYSLWGSTMTHFLTLATIHVTTVVAMLKLEMDNSSLSANKREINIFILFVCSLALLVYGAWVYAASEQKYEADFRQHENHEWNLERAHFISSMNPQLFESSANLIQKYSKDPGIHIISKYDAILPFLAKRYSAMPFFELSKFFTTPHELTLSIEKIRNDRPIYLFVDTDIKREYTLDVLDPRILYVNNFRDFSVSRVKQLELLQKVFLAVQDDYELVEQGLLISVYKRK